MFRSPHLDTLRSLLPLGARSYRSLISYSRPVGLTLWTVWGGSRHRPSGSPSTTACCWEVLPVSPTLPGEASIRSETLRRKSDAAAAGRAPYAHGRVSRTAEVPGVREAVSRRVPRGGCSSC